MRGLLVALGLAALSMGCTATHRPTFDPYAAHQACQSQLHRELRIAGFTTAEITAHESTRGEQIAAILDECRERHERAFHREQAELAAQRAADRRAFWLQYQAIQNANRSVTCTTFGNTTTCR